MSPLYGADAYAPGEIAERIETLGVAKARLPLLQMFMLAVLAGAFIGLGALGYTLVMADDALSFALSRVAGGLVFSIGLLLVVVAGAELFTGNNLLAMAWAAGRLTTGEVLRNWAVVCAGNLVGATGLAVLVGLARHADIGGGVIGIQALEIAVAKSALPADVAFFRGVLCNVLVCMAVWMAAAGRSVVDKAVAVVPPVTLFVAAGFEHCVANMYFYPLALLLKWGAADLAAQVPGVEAVTVAAMVANLGPVIAGNLLGGSVLVALVYWVIYRQGRPPSAG